MEMLTKAEMESADAYLKRPRLAEDFGAWVGECVGKKEKPNVGEFTAKLRELIDIEHDRGTPPERIKDLVYQAVLEFDAQRDALGIPQEEADAYLTIAKDMVLEHALH